MTFIFATSILSRYFLFSWVVVTKTRNHPKGPKTTQNYPKPPKTTYKTSKPNQNDTKPATTYPDTTVCSVAWLSRSQSCMAVSRPHRVLCIESLTNSQSVLSRWKQASRYIFATRADVKSKLTINFRVMILTEDFSVRSYRLVFWTGYRSLIDVARCRQAKHDS